MGITLRNGIKNSRLNGSRRNGNLSKESCLMEQFPEAFLSLYPIAQDKKAYPDK